MTQSTPANDHSNEGVFFFEPEPDQVIIDPVHGDRLLSNYNGLRTYHSYDEMTGKTTLRYAQDVESILESNQQFQNLSDGYTKDRAMQFVGSIPLVIINKWLVEDGINVWDKNHWPAVQRKLNDPEWRYLRTGLGRI